MPKIDIKLVDEVTGRLPSLPQPTLKALQLLDDPNYTAGKYHRSYDKIILLDEIVLFFMAKKTARYLLLISFAVLLAVFITKISFVGAQAENKAVNAGLVCSQASLDSQGTLLAKVKEILLEIKSFWPF